MEAPFDEKYAKARIDALEIKVDKLTEEIKEKNKLMQTQHENITDILLAIRMQVDGNATKEKILKLIDKYR